MAKLEFTPLEFETSVRGGELERTQALEFTPLEFETCFNTEYKKET